MQKRSVTSASLYTTKSNARALRRNVLWFLQKSRLPYGITYEKRKYVTYIKLNVGECRYV